MDITKLNNIFGEEGYRGGAATLLDDVDRAAATHVSFRYRDTCSMAHTKVLMGAESTGLETPDAQLQSLEKAKEFFLLLRRLITHPELAVHTPFLEAVDQFLALVRENFPLTGTADRVAYLDELNTYFLEEANTLAAAVTDEGSHFGVLQTALATNYFTEAPLTEEAAACLTRCIVSFPGAVTDDKEFIVLNLHTVIAEGAPVCAALTDPNLRTNLLQMTATHTIDPNISTQTIRALINLVAREHEAELPWLLEQLFPAMLALKAQSDWPEDSRLFLPLTPEALLPEEAFRFYRNFSCASNALVILVLTRTMQQLQARGIEAVAPVRDEFAASLAEQNSLSLSFNEAGQLASINPVVSRSSVQALSALLIAVASRRSDQAEHLSALFAMPSVETEGDPTEGIIIRPMTASTAADGAEGMAAGGAGGGAASGGEEGGDGGADADPEPGLDADIARLILLGGMLGILKESEDGGTLLFSANAARLVLDAHAETQEEGKDDAGQLTEEAVMRNFKARLESANKRRIQLATAITLFSTLTGGRHVREEAEEASATDGAARHHFGGARK